MIKSIYKLLLLTSILLPILMIAFAHGIYSEYNDHVDYFHGEVINIENFFEGRNIKIELSGISQKFLLRCTAEDGMKLYNSIEFRDSLSLYAAPMWPNLMVIRELSYNTIFYSRKYLDQFRYEEVRTGIIGLVLTSIIELILLIILMNFNLIKLKK